MDLTKMIKALSGHPEPEPVKEPPPKPVRVSKVRTKVAKEELKRRSSQSKRDRRKNKGRR